MSDFSDSDYREPRSAPTVTRDKWIAHACNKMAKGYSLIVSPKKKNATFFMRGKGYDPCPYSTAKRLLEMKLVEEAGTHSLGTIYTLIPDVLANPPAKKPVSIVDDEDEDDDLGGDDSLIDALEELEGEAEEEDEEDEEEDERVDDDDDDR